MEYFESLDLSRNNLLGEIPQSISKLTFLSVLNLSVNNLSSKEFHQARRFKLSVHFLSLEMKKRLNNPLVKEKRENVQKSHGFTLAWD